MTPILTLKSSSVFTPSSKKRSSNQRKPKTTTPNQKTKIHPDSTPGLDINNVSAKGPGTMLRKMYPGTFIKMLMPLTTSICCLKNFKNFPSSKKKIKSSNKSYKIKSSSSLEILAAESPPKSPGSSTNTSKRLAKMTKSFASSPGDLQSHH